MDHIQTWTHYRDTRRGTYEFRAQTRYRDVADRLFAMGLNNSHTVVDVGAGSCQFGRYLRERGFQGEYMPVDAVIDGTDLERWVPLRRYDFFVCIEVIEHLHNPGVLMASLLRAARVGVVVTTPNSEAVDVLGCDPTHVSVVEPDILSVYFTVERHTWFDIPNDSLLAWRQNA